MTDTRSPEQRRKIMKAVRTKHTGPELAVRKVLTRLGYRYRLHVKSLSGKPDIVFAGRRKAIFVNGCFWHAHGCEKGRAPKSRLDYWQPKLVANQERDRRNESQLRASGWDVLTLWACEIEDRETLAVTLTRFLGMPPRPRATGSPQCAIEA